MPARPHPSSVGVAPASSRPHSLSLKVLRLSKPSLAPSTLLPAIDAHPALHTASAAHPSQHSDDVLPFTPLLTLPPSFGAAYVGEAFSCTLCVNNELPRSEDADGLDTLIRDVSVQAELQTPSSSGAASEGAATGTGGITLEVAHRAAAEEQDDEGHSLRPGRSWQGIVRHDLKDEGPHVLAVTVAYTEVHHPPQGGTETEHRKRQFRKLYQFAAQQAVGVRTKIGELRRGGGGGDKRKQFAVEAQVENLTEQSVLLDRVRLELGRSLRCAALKREEDTEMLLLAPGDIEQVAFRLDHVRDNNELQVEAGRYMLAQLVVEWRMGMGQEGVLRTGWLGCLKRD